MTLNPNHNSNAFSEFVWWYRSPNSRAVVDATTHAAPEAANAFVALVVFTVILLLSPQRSLPVLAPLRIALLAAGAAAAFLVWDCWRSGRPLLNPRGEMLIALGLLAWGIFTVPLSYWPGGSVAVLLDLYIKALIVFWLLANIVTSIGRLQVLVTTLTLCTVPLAVTTLRHYATGTFLAGGNPAVSRVVGYQTALAENPNDLALMLNLLLPLSIAVFLGATRLWARALYLLIIGLDVAAVILTFSRAGFLALATIAVVYLGKLVRRRGADRAWVCALLICGMLSLPLLPSAYVDRLATIPAIEADPTGSAQARWADLVAAVGFVVEHPLVGAGVGADTLALNEVRGPHWKQTHNVYLQYAVDLGVPGVALFLLLLVRAGRAAATARRRVAHLPHLRSLFLFAESFEVSLIVFAVAALFHPVAYHFYFYFIAGLALAARSAAETAVRTTD